MKKWILFSQLLLAVFILNCGREGKKFGSQLEGHFEASSFQEMDRYRRKQRVIAEYENVTGVVIGAPLLTRYKHLDIVEEILKAGVGKIWIAIGNGETFDLNHPDFDLLRKKLGLRIEQFDTVELIEAGENGEWSRDWAPLTARVLDSNVTESMRLLDFNYFPYRPGGDSGGRTFEKLWSMTRISVPVYHESGNFMINRRGDCMMTRAVVEANNLRHVPSDMILNEQELITFYRDFAGCEKVHLFDRMPFEPTGHIDVWAKFLTDDIVIVNQLSKATIDLMSKKSLDYRNSLNIQNFLDEQANKMMRLGFQVVRVPMPAPKTNFYSHFRTYTNSLLVNGIALVPQYVRDTLGPYLDQERLPFYDQAVRHAYEKAGYRVVMIPVDQLVAEGGGAIHCSTMQYHFKLD